MNGHEAGPDAPREREFDFLRVDEFLRSLLPSCALGVALQSGLIDFLVQNGPAAAETLADRFAADAKGMRLLLDQLLANRVLTDDHGRFALSEDFLKALSYRDLMELKLEMSNLGVFDLLRFFPDLVFRPGEFARKSDFCGLFAYDRCFEKSEESVRLTRRWMRITTVLTKYEAQACLKYHDFGGYRRILDVGGNSGEFALRICRSHPRAEVTVFDLPLVCEIGAAHVQREPEAKRISFVKGNALGDPWPSDFDLVSFKSTLHDWPEEAAGRLMTSAAEALRPGGTLLVFERGPLETSGTPVAYAHIPFFLFQHSFRSPRFYTQRMQALGFRNIGVRILDLGTPFLLVTGVR
ncbi:MAG: acetylserotonin O-methyltransferase [Syntrophales bacterium]|nr:acetylserotonin O-methyltransferase [Syntrophales bacterium]